MAAYLDSGIFLTTSYQFPAAFSQSFPTEMLSHKSLCSPRKGLFAFLSCAYRLTSEVSGMDIPYRSNIYCLLGRTEIFPKLIANYAC